MKFHWEANDVKCGMYVCRNTGKDPTPGEDWYGRHVYKIGFITSRSTGTVLIAMSDGMVIQQGTPENVAEWLNKGQYMSMPVEWLHKAIDCFTRNP